MSANFRPETLMQLAGRGNVAAICRCGHRGVLDGPKLSRYFVLRLWDGRLHVVGDRLRCTRCGARSPTIRISGERPTIDFGPRDEGEWQQLLETAKARHRPGVLA